MNFYKLIQRAMNDFLFKVHAENMAIRQEGPATNSKHERELRILFATSAEV